MKRFQQLSNTCTDGLTGRNIDCRNENSNNIGITLYLLIPQKLDSWIMPSVAQDVGIGDLRQHQWVQTL